MKLQELCQTGTYVAVRPTPSTLELLQEWAQQNQLELDDDLHVTLLYSRKIVSVYLSKDEFFGAPLSLSPFGNCDIVLKLESKSLSKRHDDLIAQGGTHDYPTYTPHLTLMSKAGGSSLKDLSPIQFGLKFSNEYSEPLTE